jgi:hypothetical protein
MKVVVFSYDGSELPRDILGSMTNQMSRFIVAGSSVHVEKFNESDLIQLSVKTVAGPSKDDKDEAINHAATYISTRFGKFFKEPVMLAVAMSEVKNSSTEEAVVLKNAVQLVLENICNITLKKYGITPSVVKVIKDFSTCYHV